MSLAFEELPPRRFNEEGSIAPLDGQPHLHSHMTRLERFNEEGSIAPLDAGLEDRQITRLGIASMKRGA